MKKVLKIEGMSCMHCVSTVKKALEGIPGVGMIVVDLGNKTATIEISNLVMDETLRSAVEEEGYQVIEIIS